MKTNPYKIGVRQMGEGLYKYFKDKDAKEEHDKDLLHDAQWQKDELETRRG
jgi:hypothetical protein